MRAKSRYAVLKARGAIWCGVGFEGAKLRKDGEVGTKVRQIQKTKGETRDDEEKSQRVVPQVI